LGLGFEFVAVVLVVMRLSGGQPRRFLNAALGVALALSAAGNLVFAIPNLVLLLVFLFLLARTSPATRLLRTTLEIALSGLALFGALMYFPLIHANASSFYIGEASFSRSAWILLVRSFNYPSMLWAKHLQFPIAIVTAPAILASLLLISDTYRGTKKSVAGEPMACAACFPGHLRREPSGSGDSPPAVRVSVPLREDRPLFHTPDYAHRSGGGGHRHQTQNTANPWNLTLCLPLLRSHAVHRGAKSKPLPRMEV
jgi:hypothetical protein